MNHSETIEKLAEALAKAQGQIEGAKKESQAVITGNLKRKYADLSSVWDACRTALSENGLSVVQGTEGGPEVVTITTRLLHASGQWVESSLNIRSTKNDAQGLGSAITYGRRYSLMAMVGIAPEDDDGQAACDGKDSDKKDPPKQTTPQAPHQPQRPQAIQAAGIPDVKEAKQRAQLIMQMVTDGCFTWEQVQSIGKIGSIRDAANAGDVAGLDAALELLNQALVKRKELAEAS